MTRRFHNLLTALSLLLCVAASALWVRTRAAPARVSFARNGVQWEAESHRGWLSVSNAPQQKAEAARWQFTLNRLADQAKEAQTKVLHAFMEVLQSRQILSGDRDDVDGVGDVRWTMAQPAVEVERRRPPFEVIARRSRRRHIFSSPAGSSRPPPQCEESEEGDAGEGRRLRDEEPGIVIDVDGDRLAEAGEHRIQRVEPEAK